MKIVIKEQQLAGLEVKLEQVIKSVLDKMGGESVTGYTIDADILVNLTIDGMEKPQLIFTDREVLGQQEIFTIVPEFEGNRLAGAIDNLEVSFEAIAKSLSTELPTVAVESEYDDADLVEMGREEAGDLQEVRYINKEDNLVVRYYRAGVGLVGELTATPKETGN